MLFWLLGSYIIFILSYWTSSKYDTIVVGIVGADYTVMLVVVMVVRM